MLVINQMFLFDTNSNGADRAYVMLKNVIKLKTITNTQK